MFNDILFNIKVNRHNLFSDNSNDLGPRKCMNITVVQMKTITEFI